MPDLYPKGLRRRISLRLLAEQAGARFNHPDRPGASSHCPFYGGDNPTAFHLDTDDTHWHCLTNCPPDANDGDIFTFFMFWKRVDFKTALHDLYSHVLSPRPGLGERKAWSLRQAGEKGIQQNFKSEIPNPPNIQWHSHAESLIASCDDQLLHPVIGAPARAYLFAERGLSPETWEVFCLGLNPHDIYDCPENWVFSPLSNVGEGKAWSLR